MELKGATTVQTPDVLNARSTATLIDALVAAISDASRVVVLRGGTSAFCRGLDFGAVDSEQENDLTVDLFSNCLETIRMSSKPTIAFVEGEALGGGIGLMCACDIVISSNTSTFALTELLFGLAPAIILPHVEWRVNRQKLRWMALTAERLTAEQAHALGLVDHVCEPSRSEATLRNIVRSVLRTDSQAVRAWKTMTSESSDPNRESGAAWIKTRLHDPEVRRRIRSFLETGAPPWFSTDDEA